MNKNSCYSVKVKKSVFCCEQNENKYIFTKRIWSVTELLVLLRPEEWTLMCSSSFHVKSLIKYQKATETAESSACDFNVCNNVTAINSKHKSWQCHTTFGKSEGCRAFCEGHCEKWDEDKEVAGEREWCTSTLFLSEWERTRERPSSPTVHTHSLEWTH